MSYSGHGAVLSNVKIKNIYWGSYWTGDGTSLHDHIEAAWTDLGNNPEFYTTMEQYATPTQSIEQGSFLSGVTLDPDPASSVEDSDVQHTIELAINKGTVPPPDPNMLYVVYLPQGVVSHPDTEHGWGGHHNFFDDASGRRIYYATIIFSSSIDELTLLASHEVSEATTDPELDGWTEIGDLCQGLHPRGYRRDGFLVERLWSNDHCGCAGVLAPPSCKGLSDGAYCGSGAVNGDPDVLYTCAGGAVSSSTGCANGCVVSSGLADQCGPTFVEGNYTLRADVDGNCVATTSTDDPDLSRSSCSSSPSATWQVHQGALGFTLSNQATGKCLDVRGGSHSSGGVVQEFECNGTLAQEWLTGRAFADGSLEMINAGSGKCLDIANAMATVDGSLRQTTCDTAAPPKHELSQQWSLARR
jgi:hypothetical protein